MCFWDFGVFITCSQERKGDRRGREALLKLFLRELNDFFFRAEVVWCLCSWGGVGACDKTLTDDGGLVL